MPADFDFGGVSNFHLTNTTFNHVDSTQNNFNFGASQPNGVAPNDGLKQPPSSQQSACASAREFSSARNSGQASNITVPQPNDHTRNHGADAMDGAHQSPTHSIAARLLNDEGDTYTASRCGARRAVLSPTRVSAGTPFKPPGLPPSLYTVPTTNHSTPSSSSTPEQFLGFDTSTSPSLPLHPG
ncbi:hypothetical protein NP233_g7049 [Leucocoprinus birnbaumii]|uniref:Uncharacterized protein n=1 Tax=Leucocoprinus birnbaumii TaxID=56174 RepID=A0AAD5VQ18_9AGAR|nr:hypothetical protein NP233_g7049 [Leucocoprinus birnbaumii]